MNNEPPLEMYESLVELNFVLGSKSEISLLTNTGFEAELTNNLKLLFEKINGVFVCGVICHLLKKPHEWLFL